MTGPADAPNIATPQGNLAELFKVQGVALVREHGEPLCPSAVTAFLQAIDERLFMRAFPFPTGWEWAMCEAWSQNDQRRQSIRSGETPPDRAFDIIGFVPPELKIASADVAKSFLLQSLQSAVRSRPEWQKYMQAVTEHNEQQMVKNAAPIVAYATELAEANTETIFAEQGKTVVKVFQSEPAQETGKKRTKGRDAGLTSAG